MAYSSDTGLGELSQSLDDSRRLVSSVAPAFSSRPPEVGVMSLKDNHHDLQRFAADILCIYFSF